MPNSFHLLSANFLPAYSQQCAGYFDKALNGLASAVSDSAGDFDYYLAASSLYSSKIEGNTLDASSFIRNRGNKTFPKKKEVQEVEDLITAYRFAQEADFNQQNFLKAHSLLAPTLLPPKQRGKVRKTAVSVIDAATLRPVYMAVEPEFVNEELDKLFADIETLTKQSVNATHAFYYASIIHLWVAMIHPFADGNGRAARLAEKWFLSRTIGKVTWAIQSEKWYWDHRQEYYQNIALGYNYYALKWERCLPFLMMLPEALKKDVE